MTEASTSRELSESPADLPDNAAAAQPEVGPGRPPRDTRWKKGGPSPNPRGRPRKDQSMLPDARKAFERALNKKVAVSRGDKQVLMTRIEIGLEQLFNQFAKGDRYARRDLMDFATRLGIDFLAPHRQVLEQALAPNYQAIIDAALARRGGTAAPAARALAPPELLDEDAAEPETEAAGASPPTAVTEPEPPLIPGVQYPKPFDRMTFGEKRAWFPEYYKQQEQRNKQQQTAQKRDQDSVGRGRPAPGGFSVTTKKWS